MAKYLFDEFIGSFQFYKVSLCRFNDKNKDEAFHIKDKAVGRGGCGKKEAIIEVMLKETSNINKK